MGDEKPVKLFSVGIEMRREGIGMDAGWYYESEPEEVRGICADVQLRLRDRTASGGPAEVTAFVFNGREWTEEWCSGEWLTREDAKEVAAVWVRRWKRQRQKFAAVEALQERIGGEINDFGSIMFEDDRHNSIEVSVVEPSEREEERFVVRAALVMEEVEVEALVSCLKKENLLPR